MIAATVTRLLTITNSKFRASVTRRLAVMAEVGALPNFTVAVNHTVDASYSSTGWHGADINRELSVNASLATASTFGAVIARNLEVIAGTSNGTISATVSRECLVSASLLSGALSGASVTRNIALTVAATVAPHYSPVINVDHAVTTSFLSGTAKAATVTIDRTILASLRTGRAISATVEVQHEVSTSIGVLCTFEGSISVERIINAMFTAAASSGESAVWLMNARTGGHFQYDSGMSFNSICTYKGEVYFANASGLWKLAGTTDGTAPIEAELTTAGIDLGAKGYIFDARVHARGGEVALSSLVDEDRQSSFQVVYNNSRDGVQPRRAKGPKGVHGRLWQFKLGNVDGSACEIETLTVTPVPTRRTV